MAKRLTAKEIEHLTTPGKHWVDDNLYLQIVDAHVRSWIYRFTLNGKARWSGLGSYPGISLAAARQKRDDEQAQIRKGLDPVDERKRVRAGQGVGPRKTFKACAQDYIANHEHTWVNAKHRNQWHSTLKAYVFPVIGEVAVDAVDTEHVRAILQPLWQTKRETASACASESRTSWISPRPSGCGRAIIRPAGAATLPTSSLRVARSREASRGAALSRDRRLHGQASRDKAA